MTYPTSPPTGAGVDSHRGRGTRKGETMMTTDQRAEVERLYEHACSLRRTAQAWSEEQNRGSTKNIGNDCRCLGWNSPEEIFKASDLCEVEAGILRACVLIV